MEQLSAVATTNTDETHLISDALRRCRPDRRRLLTSALFFTVAPFLSKIPARAAAPMPFTEVAPGVFVHQGRYELQSPENKGDMANASFIIGSDAVAVIDTLGSAKVGQELRAAIKAVSDKPIRYVINSHMHPDHVFGNAAFKEDNPQFVGHHKLARGLSERASQYLAANKEMLGPDAFEGCEIILPTVSVEDHLTLDLGGRTLLLEAQKTAHTDNDLIVTDSATNTVFLADLLFSGAIPTLDGSIRGWLALIEQLERRKAARVVPGHGPHAMHLPQAMYDEQRYWSVVAADVRKLIKDGKTIQDATKSAGFSERGKWQLFDQYHVRNVTAAFAELEWE
jgi:quinoprotein relay system zinc metallohydrolase 2